MARKKSRKSKKRNKKVVSENKGTLVLGLIVLFAVYFLQLWDVLNGNIAAEDITSLASATALWVPEPDSYPGLSTALLALQFAFILLVIDVIANLLFAFIIGLVAKLIGFDIETIMLLTIFIWMSVILNVFTLLLGGSIIYFFILIFVIILYGLGIISFDKKLL